MYKSLVISILVFLTLGCKTQERLTVEQQAVLERAKDNFVFVEGGDFIMGDERFPEASIIHKVTLSSYSISKYETTYEEFEMYNDLIGKEIVYDVLDRKMKYKDYKDNPKYKHLGADYGVHRATWYQARDYCRWLGTQLHLPIDLPTEAQWEYAARSRGKRVDHATNSGKIEGNLSEEFNYGFEEVGSFPPNPLGLYDMSGGRKEWVRDWSRGIYYEDAVVNPVQDTIYYSTNKVIRGYHTLVGSVYRRDFKDPNRQHGGFRCACNKETPIN